MRPKSVEEGNEAFLIRVWKPLPSRRILNFEGKPKRENANRPITVNGGLELLHM